MKREEKSEGNAPIHWREEIWPLASILVLSSLYFFSFFNRFAGIRSGDGEFSGGVAFLAGLRPYRDYFTAGPPLNQLKSALELAIFGKLLIVSRTMAVLERLLIASTLYLWLRRIFTARAAMAAALVTIVVSAGDRSDPLASYNHDAVFAAMLSGFFASIALETSLPRALFVWSFLSGLSGGLSLLTKQTVGAAALVAVFAIGAIAIFAMFRLRNLTTWIAGFTAGAALPVAAITLYLTHLHALRACLDMLFVSGPKAKGATPFVFVSREWMIARENWMWLTLGIIALLLSALPVYRTLTGSTGSRPLTRRLWWTTTLGGAAVIVVAELLALTSIPSLDDLGKASVYYTFIGSVILGVAAILYAMSRESEERARSLQIALMAALSWASAAALSLSWPAFEPMVLPGLGLLLAAAIDGASKWGCRFLYLVMAAMIFLQVREKLDQPFSFDHQDELPIRLETARSHEPALRGMRLAPETVRLIDDAAAVIRTHTGKDDTIFTYPEMGLFYALSDRQPPTWTQSHNIDVVQDSFAREEAARLFQHPPAVVLYARPSGENMRSDEHLWREGRLSGQRSMVAALDHIVADYRLVGVYQFAPADNPVRLYVRSH